jgi:hypothetical protein
MACLRLTLLRPRPGASEETQRLLEALDDTLCESEGLVLSFVTQVQTDRLGRVALWHSKDDANREATREHILSLRSRLRHLSLDTQEVLMEVKSGHVPQELTSLLAGDLDVDNAPVLAGVEMA